MKIQYVVTDARRYGWNRRGVRHRLSPFYRELIDKAWGEISDAFPPKIRP